MIWAGWGDFGDGVGGLMDSWGCPADGFNYKLLSHRQTRRWTDEKKGG